METLANLRDRPDLGIVDPVDIDGRSPIVLPDMSRTNLACLFGELGYRKGAEVGVFRGYYSKALSRYNPDATIYSVDPWEVYDEYREKHTPESMEEAYQETQRRLAGTGCVILRLYSLEAADQFDDGELDFVYIDGNHEFVHVAQDIKAWSAKVRKGGIVSGHDWARFKRHPLCHVKDVVSAWARSHRISPWFVLQGKGNSSWFWVKA